MTKEFYAQYIRCGFNQHTHRTQKLLYVMNPTKFRVCEYLVRFHTQRGDKIIIFSDDLPALFYYCELLTSKELPVPVVCGATTEEKRKLILQTFKTDYRMNVIGLSSVGDTALDIPEANVVIQVSSHFGARRQEAQRLGRILRPKPNPTGEFNAFFYSLVSTDTREMYFSAKRQQYLVDQGYTFKIVQDLAQKADRESQVLKTKADEKLVLEVILSLSDKIRDADTAETRALSKVTEGEWEGDGEEDVRPGKGGGGGTAFGGEIARATTQMQAKRKVSGLNSVSGGGDGLLYAEFSSR
jgi:DNA excision repair protein ERCC-3